MSAASAQPPSRHTIPARRVRLDFTDIPRHWGHNAVDTHFFNGLNLVFPEGERFFIRSVRDHLDQIEDPELLAQAKGFFAQEGRHASEHERYFEALEAQGYRIRPFLRRFERFVAWNRFWPASLRLAVTAGAEHYTAAFGREALRQPGIDEIHPTMRALILWHAAEEVEHKAVAFDVLQATHPSYALRMVGFAMATLIMLVWASLGMRMLLRQDGLSRREIRALREESQRRTDGNMNKALGRAVRAYLRRDFHPDQADGEGADDLALAHRRLAELAPELGLERA